MATVDSQDEVTLGSDAIDLLECFTCGFDELLSHMAKRIATSRTGESSQIEITPGDVTEAAQKLAAILRRSELPDDVKVDVDAMMACMDKKRKHG